MKKFIAFIISLIIIIPQFIGTVSAAEEAKFECAKVQTDTTGFYVILEEPLGGPDAKYCFRVCNKVKVEPGSAIEGQVKQRVCDLRDKCDNFDYTDSKGKPQKTKDVTCQRVQILQATGGQDLLTQYVKLIYLWSAGTIGIIAVLVIVISGMQIMVSGSSGNIDEAKGRIFKALFGLVVLFLSGLILYTINPTYFV
ncbi:pilin [Patescibacteria group bacterium]